VDRLADIVAQHLAEWGASPAHVELAIYGTDDPNVIAREIDSFCRARLGTGVANGLFHQSSIGSVTGVRLEDGRQVVIKAHQPQRSRAFLEEVVRVQRHLVARGLFSPVVIDGPATLGMGQATVEKFANRGEVPNAHEPVYRRALAESFRTIVEACHPLVPTSSLPRHLLSGAHSAALWPVPHSKLFDFEATSAGAEAMDVLAREARTRFHPAGDLIIAHGDWRAEHVRFEGPTLVLAYDWDSLSLDYEAALVGYTAHAFCADWGPSAKGSPAPTLAEARAFVADYETARGHAFADDERVLCGAAFAYSCAYTARCAHALGGRDEPGSFGALVTTEGARLLDL
jgi:hypothetical protein